MDGVSERSRSRRWQIKNLRCEGQEEVELRLLTRHIETLDGVSMRVRRGRWDKSWVCVSQADETRGNRVEFEEALFVYDQVVME